LNDIFFGHRSDFNQASGILTAGRYAVNLQLYFDVFDREQIRVWILEEDVANDPGGMLRDVFSFLGLSAIDDYGIMLREFNVSLKTRACLAGNYYLPQLSLV
jgi:hypothetical protein